MEKYLVVNRVLRDMKQAGILLEVDSEIARPFLNLLWTAGYDYYRYYEINHNRKKIIYYDKQGKVLALYPSIIDAARKLKIGRGTIDDILYRKTKGRRNTGNYFRYSDEKIEVTKKL